MQRVQILAVPIFMFAFAAFVFVALPSTTSSQNQNPQGPQGSRRQQTKFVKRQNAVPNRYIVVLNDDVADDNDPREVRLARVTEIANSHALAHNGRPDYIYETALKGYAIELPNEAAAIAISHRPEVQWVEEDHGYQTGQTQVSPQPSPPWGLDSVDGTSMPLPSPPMFPSGRTNGNYLFHGDGTGVNAYVIDTGINTMHADFGTPPFVSRATQAADCIRNVDCRQGPSSGFNDQFCGPNQGPNTPNNDCSGHGTHVAATLGGNTYGVAKGVNIRSIKVCITTFAFPGNFCPATAIIAGVNWVTSEHVTNSAVPKVVNMSLWFPHNVVALPNINPAGIATAVNNSINSGVTYVVIAGNADRDARNYSPASVAAALTIGAVDWNGNRPSFSNFGPGVDLFAPGLEIVSAQTGVGGAPNGDCAFWNGSNTDECRLSGTSQAAPHVAGAAAIYLQNRTGLSNCAPFPIDGPAPQQLNANLSTCPDRLARYIKANANLDRLTNTINGILRDANGNIVFDPFGNTIPVLSANRFLWSTTVPTAPNPIESHRFFIWNQYADFLNREPDNGGMLFYVGIINVCGSDQECIKARRGLISANFFRSPEFGERGGYIANLFNIVFGQRPKTVAELSDPTKVERPHYNEFIADLQAIAGSSDLQVSLLKTTLALNWLQRSEVQAILGGLSNQAFVEKLEFTAGVTLGNRNGLINGLNDGSLSRGEVLRVVAESPEVTNKFTLQNFVTMQYIGHLRREPEDCHGSPDPANCGYIFHYNRFGTGGDPHQIENLITRGFIESPEYRRRFGPS